MKSCELKEKTNYQIGTIVFILFFSLFFAARANAGLITQHVSVGAYERDCPGLANPDYIAIFQEGIESIMGPLADQGAQAVDAACIFNSRFQSQFWNNDGSPKNNDFGFPHIPSFTDSEVGSLTITDAVASDSLALTSDLGRLEGEIKLDPDNLNLPEIKINATSSENERNSFNGYAATEYLWSGADETLEFQLNFDFYHSSESWAFDGFESTASSDLFLTAFVSENLVINPDSIFPEDSGNILATDSFLLSGSDIGETSAVDPYFGNLSVSFDVTAGQRFFVVGQYQGFAKNGGFLNAFNTITGGLNVQGLTQEESETVFVSSLQLAPPIAVSAPGAFMLALLSGALFWLRSRRT